MSRIVVSSADDSGPGTLREAMERAEPGAVITFAIGSGVQRIRLGSPLPALEVDAIIDARSQPGFQGRPLIQLDGETLDQGEGLAIKCARLEVFGLSITGFPEAGIRLSEAGGSRIECCHVGVSPEGDRAMGNRNSGISIAQSPDCIVGSADPKGRCVIGDNHHYGITITGKRATGTRVIGNYIGVALDGITPLGNHRSGICLYNVPDNVVGGPGPGEGNVISGNLRAGVNVDGSEPPAEERHSKRWSQNGDYAGLGFCTGNRVQGNLIGTCKDGIRAVPNGRHGVILAHSEDNRIGGPDKTSGNVIRHNHRYGVTARGQNAASNVVFDSNEIAENGLPRQVHVATDA